MFGASSDSLTISWVSRFDFQRLDTTFEKKSSCKWNYVKLVFIYLQMQMIWVSWRVDSVPTDGCRIASWLGSEPTPHQIRIGWMTAHLSFHLPLSLLSLLFVSSISPWSNYNQCPRCIALAFCCYTHVSLILPRWLRIGRIGRLGQQDLHPEPTKIWFPRVPSAVCAAKADAKQVEYQAGLGSTTETCYEIVTCSRRKGEL